MQSLQTLKKQIGRWVFAGMILLATVEMARGVIILSGSSPTASENFDSMGTVDPSFAPPNWTTGSTGTGTNGVITGTGADANTGSSTTGTNYNYGVAGINLVTERALGSLPSSTGNRAFEVAFSNATGTTITQLDIEFDGEQWRDGGNAATTSKLDLFFSKDGATFTALGATFAFTAVSNNASSAAMDGNFSLNRLADIGGLYITNILAGETFYLRWLQVDNPGAGDDGLAIDNFSLQAFTVPEPSLLFLLAAGAGMLWKWRRRY